MAAAERGSMVSATRKRAYQLTADMSPNIPVGRQNDDRPPHDDVPGGSSLLGPSIQDRFIFPGRPGHPPRRPSSRWTRPIRLGWSLVLPGGSVDEVDLDVTRFFKRLCSEGRRNSVPKVGNFRKAVPPGPK